MEREQLNKIGTDMVYLASCALRGIIPDRSRIEAMSLHNLHKMAKRHHMSSIIYMAVASSLAENPDITVDSQLMESWKGEYHLQLQLLVRFDIEREALCNFLKENNVWYIVLKGVVLQNYYPTLGMREMCDNDILVDESYCELIKEYFVLRGYKVVSYGKGCHDIYFKSGLCFEIHRTFARDEERMREAYKYYKNVKSMLLPTQGSTELVFGDDDFYVYYVFHSHKHFKYAGCGVRTLMDFWVYLSKEENKLNFEYVDREISKLGAYEYEKASTTLAKSLFSVEPERLYDPDVLTDEERELFIYYVSSGTYGTQRNYVDNLIRNLSGKNKITRVGKFKYILGRLFPKMEYYKSYYPLAYKLIFPIPFVWFCRLIKGIFKIRTVGREIKYINKRK